MEQLLIAIDTQRDEARRTLENVFSHLIFDEPKSSTRILALVTISKLLDSIS